MAASRPLVRRPELLSACITQYWERDNWSLFGGLEILPFNNLVEGAEAADLRHIIKLRISQGLDLVGRQHASVDGIFGGETRVMQ
jgi:hypothetical protein